MHLTRRLKSRSHTSPADQQPTPATLAATDSAPDPAGAPATDPAPDPVGTPESAGTPESPGAPDRDNALHINAAGELVIDLRTPIGAAPEPTSAMPCSTCGAILAIDSIDHIADIAVMRCPDCGFTFSHRLVRT